MGFQSIKASIVTGLGTITDIKQVFNYGVKVFQAEINEFPVALVVPASNDSSYLSTGDNQRVYNFKVWVIGKTDGISSQVVQDSVESIVDQIMDYFDSDANNTLGDTVTHIEATPADWDQVQTSPSEVAIVASVMLKCHQLYDVT